MNTHVDLSLELLYGLHGAWGNDDHAAADLLAFNTSEKSTHVVTRLALHEMLD